MEDRHKKMALNPEKTVQINFVTSGSRSGDIFALDRMKFFNELFSRYLGVYVDINFSSFKIMLYWRVLESRQLLSED